MDHALALLGHIKARSCKRPARHVLKASCLPLFATKARTRPLERLHRGVQIRLGVQSAKIFFDVCQISIILAPQ